MRMPAGTVTFTAALLVSLLLIAAAAFGLMLLVTQHGAEDALRGLPSNPWWFAYGDSPGRGVLGAAWRIGSAIAASAIALAFSFRVRGLFRRGASPILPFLMLFLFAQSLECLRAATGWLAAVDGSISAAIVLTEVMYWGRFAGLFALLLGGLYCIDLRYRRYGFLFGVVSLVSFAMAAYIPIDRTVFLAQLTWKLGDEQGVWFVNFVIGFLVLATSGMAAVTRHDRRFLWLCGGFALLPASRELLFFSVEPTLLIAGLAALFAGLFTCVRTLSVMYRQAGQSTTL